MIRRYLFHATILAITFMFASAANAHLCMLKNGDYTLTDADVCASGAGTTPLEVDFYTTDSEIALDVVFQQDATTKKTLDAYQAMIQFDPAMGDPANCNCHDARDSKTSPPPGDLCDDDAPTSVCGSYPVIWNDIASSLSVGLVDDFITLDAGNYYAKAVQGTLGKSTANTNLLMQSLVFKNIYTTTPQAAAYTFSFNPFTNLFDGDFCELLTTPCGAAVQHVGMSTILNIEEIPCITNAPTVQSIACAGQAGCSGDTGPADATLTFTLPNACKFPDNTPAPCSNFSVDVTPVGGGSTSNKTSSPFTEVVTMPISVSYSLVGKSTGCSNSAAVVSTSAQCRCGDPPVIVREALKTPYIDSAPINIKYNVTDPEGVGISQLKFYYTNDPVAARIAASGQAHRVSSAVSEVNLINLLAANGDVTATIPGTHVKADTDIYFAIVAQASGLETSLSENFDPSDENTIFNTTTERILGSDIIVGTSFNFVEGHFPYPNRFPFRPGGDGEIKSIVSFKLNETAEVSARIYSMDGRLIRHLDNTTVSLSSCTPSAPHYCNMCKADEGCIWDGTTYEGGNKYVANGMYIFNIYAVSTGQNFGGSTIDYTKGIVVMK